MIKVNADSTLKQAEKYIKRAWITAIFCGAWTLVFPVIEVNNPIEYALIGVIVSFILAYGIYRKSRVSAILMTANFVLGQILFRSQSVNEHAWLTFFGIPLLITYFFVRGVQGTFIYHRLTQPPSSSVTTQRFQDNSDTQT